MTVHVSQARGPRALTCARAAPWKIFERVYRQCSGVLIVACCWLPCAATGTAADNGVQPQDRAGWEVMLSPYAYHFRHSSAHRSVFLLGLEKYRSDHWLWGIGVFSNSFGQPAAYAYGGYQWNGLLGEPRLYAKLTAGIMYGYVGEHKNKVPFNHGGWSPVVVPAIGYRINAQHALQVSALGSAGLLFSYQYRLR